MNKFVSLHNHTHYSLLNSLIAPKDIFMRAQELGQPAVGITDRGSLSGAWESLKASKETGVKLVIGCEFYFVNDVENNNDKIRYVVLLAKNAIGYSNILKLNRRGFDHSILLAKRIIPLIDWKLLREYSEGVICLTACGNGIVGQLINSKKFDEAEFDLQKLIDIFGSNLGIEVQPNALIMNATYYNQNVNQLFTNFHLIRLAQKYNIKVVPACNAHYLNREDAEIHNVLLAIGSSQPIYSNARQKFNVPDFYLKSYVEVETFFARNYNKLYGEKFASSICENTIYFTDLCEEPKWIDPKFSNPLGHELPIFPVKDEPNYVEYIDWLSKQPETIQKLEEDKSFLRFKCLKAFESKVPKGEESKYLSRLYEELDVLEYRNFSSYMLVVGDMLNWAQRNGIRIGYGRGSCGGCLVAFLLGIHIADPIKHNLIFERFMNKEKADFPDIDSDIVSSGREKVQEYIINKYGFDKVAHVSNINTITPKVYVRDICRSCELGGSRADAVKLGDDIADSIPKYDVDGKELRTISDVIEKAPLFIEYSKKYPELLKYAAICGKMRAVSTHAGGIIIANRSLEGLIPLRKDKDGCVSIEVNKKVAEENGLVKIDILGIETLDIIDNTYKLIKQSNKIIPPDPPNFYEYDEETYNLISRGDTFCVFQLGTSSGMIDLCKKYQPKTIEDLANINALVRPSARGIRDAFIAAKDGKKKVELLHPLLKRSFGFTYGFGLYEESLMYLAQDIAGWSLRQADRLRILTKNKGKDMKATLQCKIDFIEDAKKNGIAEQLVTNIWENVIDKFQGYGFNVSHAIFYSLLGYHTAYLKAHYPIEFLLANLMSELQSNTKDAPIKVEKIKQEIRNHSVKILPPDINRSEQTYNLINENTLLTGLDALKFVGDDAIMDIIKKRPFNSFLDFMSKIDAHNVRSTTIQALVASGCLDSFSIPRKSLYLYCSDYKKKLQIWLKKHNLQTETFEYPWPNEGSWGISEMYALEKMYLGEAFICQKSRAYNNFFTGQYENFSKIRSYPNKQKVTSLKAEIKNVADFKIKKETSKYFGETMLKLLVEDENNEQCMLTIFPDRMKNLKEQMKLLGKKIKLEDGVGIHFSASVNIYEDNFGLILNEVYSLCLPPQPPKDLKSKKISLKNDIKSTKANKQDLKEEMVDYLYNEGLIDLDEDNGIEEEFEKLKLP